MTDPPALEEAKAALRSRMRELRRDFAPADRERMASLAGARLLALPEVRRAGTILLFSSFGSEVPTPAILDRLVEAGKRVLLPYLEGEAMEAAAYRRGELVGTAYGPREPAHRVPVPPQHVDVAVVPGLAFDRGGYRIGYGGGYYDRYLRLLSPDTFRVGVGFHVQVVDEVPHGEGDERLDAVVTDRETIRVGPRPGTG